MANAVYNFFKEGLMMGSYNLEAAPTIYGCLVGSNYAPDVDAHKYHADLTEVVTPSNYTASFALSSPAVTQDDTGNQGLLDAADILIATVTFATEVRACVLFGSSGNGSVSDPLIAYIDFTTNQAVTAGTFQITWDANGILALT